MRIGLLTEGGYPYVTGEATLWCDRLVHGLAQHEFDLYALSRTPEQQRAGLMTLPDQVRQVFTAPRWAPPEGPEARGGRARRRFTEHYTELAASLTAAPGDPTQADRFGAALRGLADLAWDHGVLTGLLRSETAVRALERACRTSGAPRAVHGADVADLLTVAAETERALRALSLDWYDDEALARADVCHAASGGVAALPGLLAQHYFGVPLLVTEYGVQLRARYLRGRTGTPPVRALLAALHGRLTTETYRTAALVTSGNAHAGRWQRQCGADPGKLRTVHPGLDAARFAEAAENGSRGDPDTLVWVGRIAPAKDLDTLLRAFAELHARRPATRLRLIGAHGTGPVSGAYLTHCRVLARSLLGGAEGAVTFEDIHDPATPELAAAYTAGAVVVLSSTVEGFPVSLVEAMFCGCATVSTDTGAVPEIIGGTGLVVPPRDPAALADACAGLLSDPERRALLGAAARARALELFTVEQNISAFHDLYLDLVSLGPTGFPTTPFAHPAEARVAVSWTSEPPHAAGGPAAPERSAEPGPVPAGRAAR